MNIFEIISAIVLIIACVFIVIVVLMQDTKTQMSKTISGSSSDNYYGKNSGRTKEAKLNRAMTTAAIVFFVLAIIVNVANVYFGRSQDAVSGADTSSSTVTSSEVSDTAATAEGETSSDASQAGSEGESTASESTPSEAPSTVSSDAEQ